MKLRIVIIMLLSATSYLYSSIRNDYSLDITPQIKKNKTFSVGLGGILAENNAWFDEGTLLFYHPDATNLSMRNLYLNIMPYFEFRPIKNFLEIGISTSFTYKRNDTRDDLTSLNSTNSIFAFDSIHSFIKVNPINWYLSVGFRFDVDYSFYNHRLNTEEEHDRLDFTATMMIAVVPKIIPLNLLINYRMHTGKKLSQLGELVGALEFITSPIIDLYLGTTFVFPYFSDDKNMYIEPFAKFNIKIDDFLHITSAYRKIAWGNNLIPNSSTFLVSIEYMF